MIHGGRLQAAVEANVVHAIRESFERRVDLDSQLSGAPELEGAAHEVALARVHRCFELVALLDELGHVQIGEFRFGVERVDVAGTALHEKEDAIFRLGGMMTLLGGEHAGPGALFLEHRREGHRAEAHAGVEEELAA